MIMQAPNYGVTTVNLQLHEVDSVGLCLWPARRNIDII